MNIRVCSVGGDPGDMVIFTDWCLFPVIPRSTCGLPMAGEDTGLEAEASPLVGYLGKVSNSSILSCCHVRKAELYLKKLNPI